jgi:hypothetical protein
VGSVFGDGVEGLAGLTLTLAFSSRGEGRWQPTARSNMQIDLLSPSRPQRYKVMMSLVVPRPIALISTLGENGVLNAAPFSYFNVLGEALSIVVFSADARASGPKRSDP